MDTLDHGNGSIISSDGYIVTNYHVISQGKNMRVKSHNDRSFPISIVRYDPECDLALVKIDTTNLKTFNLNLNKDLVGENIYVAGTPKDTLLSNGISGGIISGQRTYHNVRYLQTDAAINSGNSGGGMVLQDGTMAGIINSKFSGYGI